MTDSTVISEFIDFVSDAKFPCVGAKAALVQKAINILDMSTFSEDGKSLGLYLELLKYGEALDFSSPIVKSFAAIFPTTTAADEVEFESMLWDHLQTLHNVDRWMGKEWDLTTNPNPHSPKFSMSIGETSFFIIGLHPNASRPARRFKYPTYIFNSTAQFAQLREDGRFEKLQKIIRARDAALAGDINPMLSDFGERSEARQYSGRQLSEDWTAPLTTKEPVNVKNPHTP